MEDEYEVYRVVDRKFEAGIVWYKIQWKHFLPKYSTWEPEANLDCIEMVKKFEEKRVQQIIGDYSNWYWNEANF